MWENDTKSNLDGLKQWMEREGETNLSAAIEGFIDCVIRDTCEGGVDTI